MLHLLGFLVFGVIVLKTDRSSCICGKPLKQKSRGGNEGTIVSLYTRDGVLEARHLEYRCSGASRHAPPLLAAGPGGSNSGDSERGHGLGAHGGAEPGHRRGRGAWASFLQVRIKPWEYGLGDKAYVGQRQIITEWKGRNLSLEKHQDGAALPWACGAPHWPGSGQPYGSVHYVARLVHPALVPACRGHEDRGAHGWAPGAYEGT